MNNVFTAKLLNNLRSKKGDKGFTLIELLVVVIIIGVLAAVALPNLLGQVAKGRQAEAKNNLGALNRAQQAYRLENGVFGDYDGGELNNLIAITGEYYQYGGQAGGTAATVDAADSVYAFHTADAVTAFDNDIINMASAVGQQADGTFEAIICEADSPTADNVATTNNAGDVDCGTAAATP